MALYQLPGNNLGENLGKGVATGLETLLGLKVKEVQRQRNASALSALGYNQQEAQQLGNLDAALLEPIIKERTKAQNQLQTTGPGLKVVAPELSENEATKIGSLSKGVQNLWYRDYLNSPELAIERLRQLPDNPKRKDLNQFTKSSMDNLKLVNQQPNNLNNAEEPISNLKQKFTTPTPLSNNIENQQIAQLQQEETQPSINAPIMNEKPKKVSDYMREGYTKEEARDLSKADIKRVATDEKESLNYYNKTLENAKGSEGFNKRLGRMSYLIENGSLPIAAYYNTLEELSNNPVDLKLPIIGPLVNLAGNLVSKVAAGVGKAVQKSITSRDLEEFDKITQDFEKDAKNFYGNRITNTELEQFLKMIPTLSQTDNGKRAVIRNMKNFNDAAIKEQEVMEDIIKRNRGRRPTNLALLVQDEMKEYKDKSARDYIEGISNIQNEIIELPWQQVFASNKSH